jgi:hypothetical protein
MTNQLIISATRLRAGLLTIAALGAFAIGLRADENLWIYTKSSESLPEGEVEILLKSINRSGKDSGSYSFWDVRPEIEYGLTDRLTLRAEAMIFRHDYSNVEWPPFDEVPSYHSTSLGGYEIGAKYNILSPFKAPVGLAFGFNFEHRFRYRLDGAHIDQDSFVPVLYLQKNFLENTLVFAWSTKIEFERRRSPGVLEEEIGLDTACGISYRVAPRWYVGCEIRYQSDFLNPQLYDEAGNEGFDENGFELGYSRTNFDLDDFRWGSQYQYGTYFGPTVHYAAQKWWMTVGLLWQVKGGGSEARNPSIRGSKSYDEHEKTHFGLSIGHPF